MMRAHTWISATGVNLFGSSWYLNVVDKWIGGATSVTLLTMSSAWTASVAGLADGGAMEDASQLAVNTLLSLKEH
jgi:hypothetical protein